MLLFGVKSSRILLDIIMLLPDNIHPENSIYYNGAIVLQALQQQPSQELLDLFQNVRGLKEMSMPIFILCLDWLFLLDVISMDAHQRIALCS